MSVMIVATALIRGFKNEISEKVYGFWGHINITDTRINTSMEEAPIQLDTALLSELTAVGPVPILRERRILGRPIPNTIKEDQSSAGIRHVQSYALKAGIIKYESDLEGIVLKGVDSTFDWDHFRQFLTEGDIIADTDSTTSRGIVISQTTANRLDLEVGDRFRIYFLKEDAPIPRGFEISGIYNTNLEEYDRKFAIADIDVLRPLLGYRKDEISGLEVFVDDIDDIGDIRNHIYIEMLPANLFPSTIKEKDSAIFDWLELQNYNEIVIITLMVLVSIINMITAILILILERTNMIGILKSLGQSNWGIRKIFLYQAAVIVGRGLIIGNVLGLLICILQKYTEFIKLDEAEYYLTVAPIELNPWMILTLNIGTLMVVLIALVLPSYYISNVSPIKAIRFK
ncbi:MAG: ABC transporter permease [Bacteroidia bacterium]|nr:ABC transporter permease [Bacteroidia bacterium]